MGGLFARAPVQGFKGEGYCVLFLAVFVSVIELGCKCFLWKVLLRKFNCILIYLINISVQLVG